MTSHDVLTYLDDICIQSDDICIQSEYVAQALQRMTYEEFLQDPLYNSGYGPYGERQYPDG